MISSVVILYHPDSSINDNLKPILEATHHVYVIDNTEQPQKEILHPDIFIHPKLTYLHSGSNEGIAQPLNIICRLAIKEGYKYLLTMDQDSFFRTDDLKRYINYVEQFPAADSVGMFGVNHAKEDGIKEQNSAYDFVTRLITSGSIINLLNFDRIGDFDEKLFIDHVDSEYCFRVLMAGYKNVFFKNVFLEHRIGIAKEFVSLKSLKTTSRSLHSPIRIYYMARNFLYLSSRYEQHFPTELSIIKKDIFNRIKNNFLYSTTRWKMVRYIVKAVTDFRKGKMGKIAA